MESNPLNNYVVKMSEYNLGRNPTSVEVEIILMSQERDHYQDSQDDDNAWGTRIKKRAVINKNNSSMHYVQFAEQDELLEDTDKCPWTMTLTQLNLPRIIQTDDRVLIDGMLYTISMVAPVHRKYDGLLNCTIYPERSEVDDLAIYATTTIATGALSFTYGGAPTHVGFSNSTLETPTTWKPFVSYVIPTGSVLWIKDSTTTVNKELI